MRPFFFALVAVLLALPADSAIKGWNLEQHSIPLEEIRGGGPPKDGIPALDGPRFTTVEKDTFLKPEDRVLGLVHHGEARAYPIRILSWHEIVNDTVAGDPLLVSW